MGNILQRNILYIVLLTFQANQGFLTFSKPYIKESMADDSKDQQLDPQVHPALETKVVMN